MELYEQLEVVWADTIKANRNCVVACSTGTAAIQLVLEAFGFPRGGEVIIPNFTMIACARAVTMAGLVPVFVDCKENLLIDENLIEEKITSKTCAIMPVHIYGRTCNLRAILEIANKYDLKVIEDCAEAHGIPRNEETDAQCWSFYKNKIIAGEEGGAVCFNEDLFASMARSIRSQGFTPTHNFKHIIGGMSCRLSNANAEPILRSLDPPGLSAKLEMRRRVSSWYDEFVPNEYHMPKRDVDWVYDIKLPEINYSKKLLMIDVLNSKGIQVRHSFYPMSGQAEYINSKYPVDTNQRCFEMYRRVMYFPISTDMSKSDVEHNVSEFLRELNY